MKNLFSDFAFLLRQVTRRPLLYLLVVFILALGIGANTAMFTLTDAVLFRELPVQEPERLVRIFSAREKGGVINANSWPDYMQVREHADGARDAAAYTDSMPLHIATDGAVPERINGGLASGNFFQVLGVQPQFGRLFTDEDDRNIGGHPVAVLSHHYWQTRFGGSTDAIGTTVDINRQPFTVIGVLPKGFGGIDVRGHVDLWLPLAMAPAADPFMSADVIRSEGWSWLDVVARLEAGVTPEQLQAELDVRAQAEAEILAKQQRTGGLGPWQRVLTAQDAAVDPYGIRDLKRNAFLLTGVVLLALLLACTNVAGLLSVRAEEREREFAVRASLGASRLRLVRMLLLETLLLATAGALAGLAVARAVLTWVAAQAPGGIVLPVDPAGAVLDQRVLFVTTVIAVVTTLLVGITPALRGARVDFAPVLKGGVTASAGRERVAWRSCLVALQIAISALILVAAGLLLKSFWNTMRVDPGFEPRGAVMVMLDPSRHGLAGEKQQAFLARVQERVAALPGVTAAGFSQTVPVQNGGWITSVDVGQLESREDKEYASVFVITPGFLDALGVDVVAGRDFAQTDMTAGAGDVVLVNETMAETFWPGGNALGQRVLNQGENGARVVGIVADHKILSVREPPRAALYKPLLPDHRSALNLLVRAERDPITLLSEIRRVIRELDPELPVLRERTLEAHLASSYSEARLFAFLLGGFAVLALLLAAAGLYGMLAHVLRMRQREFGIRMALGADSANIAGLVLRQVATLAVIGLVTGLVAAAFAGQVLEGMLFGVAVLDVATFASVGALVVIVAACAGFLPLRRATSTQPTEVLREE